MERLKQKAAELVNALAGRSESEVRRMYERLAWRWKPIPKFVAAKSPGQPRPASSYRAERRNARRARRGRQ